MSAQLTLTPVQKFFDNNGTPLEFGLLFTYVAGTTTKQATYIDSTQTTPNTNPIVLNARGECQIWLDPTKTYKFILSSSSDTDPPTQSIWTVDNVNGAFSPVLTSSYLGSILYPRTSAEVVVGVTPTNYSYPTCDIRRYGGIDDGVTDNSAALLNVLKVAYASGLPAIIPQTGSFYAIMTAATIAAMTGNMTVLGQGQPELRYIGTPTNYLVLIQATAGFDIRWENITFNCNLLASKGMRTNNSSVSMATANIGRVYMRRCRGINGYMSTGLTQGSSAFLFFGGYQSVILEDCEAVNMNRDTGAGTAGSQGCAGFIITANNQNGYCPQLIVRGGVIDTITNKEVTGTGNDVDCDGIIYNLPNPNTNSNNRFPASMVVDGTTFKECKGRDVKSQADGYNIVTNFTSIHSLEQAINNAICYDFQRGAGCVSDGSIFYYPTAGAGKTFGNSQIITQYNAEQQASTADQKDGGFYVRGVTIYNAVPRATATLPNIVSLVNSNTSNSVTGLRIRDVNHIGGRLARFVSATGGTSALIDLVVEGCSGDITTSLVRFSNSVSPTLTTITASDNSNTGPSTPILIELQDNSNPLLNGYGNQGFAVNRIATTTTSTIGEIIRPKLIGGDSAIGHSMATQQTTTVADTASFTFDNVGIYGIGIITTNFSQSVQAIFSHSSAGCILISSATNVSVGAANADPNTAGALNIWIDGSGLINIHNRLGSSRVFNFLHIGGN